jgi:hypothetical protein
VGGGRGGREKKKKKKKKRAGPLNYLGLIFDGRGPLKINVSLKINASISVLVC